MKTSILLGCFLTVFLALPARAELPDYVLDREYQGCVGNDKDAKHAAYCDCVREGMRGWSEDDYVAASMQTLAASPGSKAQTPNILQDLAKSCIAKVLQ
jgi:hypothetical protein